MVLDPKKHADWEIAQDAETRMKTVQQLGRDMGLLDKELLPYGHVMGKVDYRAVLERLGDKPNGKYVDVTAITPTPLGEGKSTTTIGLVQGLGRRNKRASAAIRQPSGGPTMGVKGSAAGGGLSQCIPLTQYSLGFTGDINAVMNAHNLAMVALTSRMQHERNYNDEKLLKLSGMPRLNIDPTNVNMGWVMDFCCQSLRNIIIGMDGTNGRSDGFMMRSRFDIAVSSEVMAILAIAKDLKDLRQRMGKIIVAYDRDGKPVTTADGGSHQPEPYPDHRRPARVRTRRAVRQHRHRAEFGHRGPHRPQAERIPCYGVRFRRGHRLREVLEPQMPLQRPDSGRRRGRGDRPRAQEPRRRARARAGAPSA